MDPSQVRKVITKQLDDLKRKVKAEKELREISRKHEAEKFDMDYKVNKIYKPFVQNLDDKLKPIVADIDSKLQPITVNIENVNKELAKQGQIVQKTYENASDVQQELNEYNERLANIQKHNQEQLAIENIPEKYYNVIGITARNYLANKDSNDSLGMRWDEDTEEFVIGNVTISIDSNSNLTLLDPAKAPQTMVGTEGLWKLLTQKNPYKQGEPRKKWKEVVPEQDILSYARIMYFTKACYRTGKNGYIKRSSSATKWTEIIKPYLERKEAEMAKQRSRSLGDPEGSGLTILPLDKDKLYHKLFVILGNIQAGHTNISNDDIHVASEILEHIKSSLSSIAYNRIAHTLSTLINGKYSKRN